MNYYINELRLLVPACAASTSALNKVAVLKQTVDYLQLAPQRDRIVQQLPSLTIATMEARLADQEARLRSLVTKRTEQQGSLEALARHLGADLTMLEDMTVSREVTRVWHWHIPTALACSTCAFPLGYPGATVARSIRRSDTRRTRRALS